ncbi:MAG: type II toxin-antitoxin system RelE/ParE family toxin [Candidatus Hodarchaeota archaeon]
MAFKVKWHQNARKSLRKLHPEISKRIVKKVKEAAEYPFRYLEHYEGDSCFKFRIGDYRLLVDVDHKNNILIVRVLDKRGRIYKR